MPSHAPSIASSSLTDSAHAVTVAAMATDAPSSVSSIRKEVNSVYRLFRHLLGRRIDERRIERHREDAWRAIGMPMPIH
ncbi:hypothetical protein [Sinomonas atrocyanea]|uniref:hypothetical protein n=1 Tax=Sinomonas atrocyanea TaxID=37927 RepID=UPI003D993806